jgi:hypothetical protein
MTSSSEAHDEALKELRRDLMRFEALPPQSPEAVWEWAWKANAHIQDLLRSATPANALAVAEWHDRLGAMLDHAGHPDYSLREMFAGLRQLRDDMIATLPEAPQPATQRIEAPRRCPHGFENGPCRLCERDAQEQSRTIRTWASAYKIDDDELCIVKVKDLQDLEQKAALSETPAGGTAKVPEGMVLVKRDAYEGFIRLLENQCGRKHSKVSPQRALELGRAMLAAAPSRDGNDNETGGAR